MFENLAFPVINIAIVVVFALLGSIISLGKTISAGTKLLSQEKERYNQVLLLCLSSLTQIFYGSLFVLFVLVKNDFFSNLGKITNHTSSYLLGCLPIAVCCLFAGVYQGNINANFLKYQLESKNDNLIQIILLSGFLEMCIILGLLASIGITNLF